MPSSRPYYLHSTVLYSGYMLVAGGNSHNETTESSGSQCYSNTVQAYDICKCFEILAQSFNFVWWNLMVFGLTTNSLLQPSCAQPHCSMWQRH